VNARLIQIRANLLGILHWREAYPKRYLPSVYRKNILGIQPSLVEFNIALDCDDLKDELLIAGDVKSLMRAIKP
jgi:hypothetical protein